MDGGVFGLEQRTECESPSGRTLHNAIRVYSGWVAWLLRIFSASRFS